MPHIYARDGVLTSSGRRLAPTESGDEKRKHRREDAALYCARGRPVSIILYLSARRD